MNMPIASTFVEVAASSLIDLVEIPASGSANRSAFSLATLPTTSRLTAYDHAVLSPDAQLMLRIAEGHQQAYETFVRTYSARMHAVARRLLRCDNEADDAVQDALICIYRKAGSFKSHSNLWTWIHRVTINASLMRLRSARETTPLEAIEQTATNTSDAEPHGSVLERLERDELRAHVRACIDELPQSYREIILLRDIEEHDTEATAQLLGISPANVKTRLHRARQALREVMMESRR